MSVSASDVSTHFVCRQIDFSKIRWKRNEKKWLGFGGDPGVSPPNDFFSLEILEVFDLFSWTTRCSDRLPLCVFWCRSRRGLKCSEYFLSVKWDVWRTVQPLDNTFSLYLDWASASHSYTHPPAALGSLFLWLPALSLRVGGAWLWLCISPTSAQQQLAGAGHTAVPIAAARGPSALRHRSGEKRRRRRRRRSNCVIV